MTTKSNFIFSYNSTEYSTVRHIGEFCSSKIRIQLKVAKRFQQQSDRIISRNKGTIAYKFIASNVAFYPEREKLSKSVSIDYLFIAVVLKTLSQQVQQKMYYRLERYFSVSGPLKPTHYTRNNEKAECYFQFPKIKVVDFLLIMK